VLLLRKIAGGGCILQTHLSGFAAKMGHPVLWLRIMKMRYAVFVAADYAEGLGGGSLHCGAFGRDDTA
jgi:hypothetical protein